MSDDLVTEKAALMSRRAQVLHATGYLLIAFLALATLSGRYLPLGPPGIDPGWKWAINQAAENGWVFGRDIVFTYGPLGFLMVPMDVASNLLVANLFLILTQILFAVALTALYDRQPNLGIIVLFALLFICAKHQGLAMEGGLLLIIGLSAAVAVVHDRPPLLGAAAVLSAVALMVKMSLGIAGAAMLVVAAIVGRFLFHRPWKLAIPLLLYPLAVAALAFVSFDSIGTFVDWVRLSLEVVSGYSVAMSLRGSLAALLVGSTVMVGWLAAPLLAKNDQQLLACNLVFAPVVLIQFRLAFVRQDSHQLQFIPFMLAAVAASLLFCRHRRQMAAHAAAFTLVLVSGSAVELIAPAERGLLPRSIWQGGSGPRSLAAIFNLDQKRAELADTSREQLSPLLLPGDWQEQLAGSESSVGTIPWEIQYAPANNLSWSPTPTLQLYSSYTEALDEWSAHHYASNKAPRFILNEMAAVGRRCQFFDAPLTWRTVFTHYRLESVWTRNQPLLLLERRPVKIPWQYVEIARDTLRIEGDPIQVPQSRSLVFAEPDLRLTLGGRIQKTVFRVPMIFLVMEHASGKSSFCRLIPATAGNGILVNAYPHDATSYLQLWRGHVLDPVVRCAITGPGEAFFRAEIPLVWYELRLEDTP
ncbi:MAG: hypothetical protein PVG92_00420 [Holophagae bacterium]|jgi:hypothetical protein